MMRLCILLLTAVLGSAFYLVRLQYQSRVLFTAVDREQAAARRLETERDALDVQRRAQAAALRVDSTARTRLQMREAGTVKRAADFEEGSLKPCLILKGQTKPAQAPIVASPAAFCRAPPAPAPGRMRAALRCARPRPAGQPSFAGWHALRRPR